MQTYAALEHLVVQLVLHLSMQMSTQTTNTVLPWRRALLALPQVCTLHSPSLTPYILPYIQMFTLVKGGTVFHTLVPHTECHCISGVNIIFVSLPHFITPHVFACPVWHYHSCVDMQPIFHELYLIYLTSIPISFTSRTPFMPHVAGQHLLLNGVCT